MQPRASRPRLPADYGVPSHTEGTLRWSFVTERMTVAIHYWLSTTSPDGQPHVRPIDGMWLDDKLYFGGSAESKWVRNLSHDSRACVNLENAEQAVILHGVTQTILPDRTLAIRLAEASNTEYGQAQTPEDYESEEILVFSPEVVLAWKVLCEDATRWRFE